MSDRSDTATTYTNGRPRRCRYCKGTGRSDDANECGFCDGGVPLDTQEDWDRTWGTLFERHAGNGSERAAMLADIDAADEDD